MEYIKLFEEFINEILSDTKIAMLNKETILISKKDKDNNNLLANEIGIKLSNFFNDPNLEVTFKDDVKNIEDPKAENEKHFLVSTIKNNPKTFFVRLFGFPTMVGYEYKLNMMV